MGWYAVRGHDGRKRSDVPRQALPFTLAGGPDDHREPVVRTLVLRAQDNTKGGGQWSALATPSAAALSTRESLQKRVSSRTSIRCMRSAKPARPSSRANRVKAGGSSKRPTMTVVSPVGTWSDLHC